jgi:predicted outer membrane protein
MKKCEKCFSRLHIDLADKKSKKKYVKPQIKQLPTNVSLTRDETLTLIRLMCWTLEQPTSMSEDLFKKYEALKRRFGLLQ